MARISRHDRHGQSRYGEGDVLAVPAMHKNGATISIEFTIMPLHESSGAIIALVAFVRDVTKRFEEIRRLKQKLAEIHQPPKAPS